MNNIKFRILGDTELSVSEIGLGGEWLSGLDKNLVKDLINNAVNNEINFFDFLFNELSYIKNIGHAIKGHREDIILQCHLGTGEENGKPKRERNVKKNKNLFNRTLSYLKTNYVDIINIQFIMEKEYKELIGENGLLKLANQLKEEGKARYIGASTHNINIGIDLANNKLVDTIMFPINIGNHFLERRKEFLNICKTNEIGLIAIKPFMCGKLFEGNQTVYVAKYQTGGVTGRKKIPKNISPFHCLNYCLSQKGISTVIPGVKSIREMEQILLYNQLNESQKDYVPILKEYYGME